MDRIPQVDLAVGDDDAAALTACIDRRWLSEGPQAAALQQAIRDHLSVPHVHFAPNGTLGLWLALMALDLPRGGEVVMPSFTFYATAMAAVFAGLTPVFVDCDGETFNARVAAFEAAITPRTVALTPAHIYGQVGEIDAIAALAHKRGLRVVEDAAQALGVRYKGAFAGTFGDIGVFSLFSDKTVTAGEGGILVTRDSALAEKIALLRNQGRPNAGSFVHPALGLNLRITDMQAAVALAQFRIIGTLIGERQRKWALYMRRLEGVGDLQFMRIASGSECAPFRFPILSQRRDDIASALQAANIETRGFFYPLHLQPKLRIEPAISLPVSERLHARGVCLPIHPRLNDGDIGRICDVIAGVFE